MKGFYNFLLGPIYGLIFSKDGIKIGITGICAG
jgi:hypothetical protein